MVSNERLSDADDGALLDIVDVVVVALVQADLRVVELRGGSDVDRRVDEEVPRVGGLNRQGVEIERRDVLTVDDVVGENEDGVVESKDCIDVAGEVGAVDDGGVDCRLDRPVVRGRGVV